jgi:hypothetical protein
MANSDLKWCKSCGKLYNGPTDYCSLLCQTVQSVCERSTEPFSQQKPLSGILLKRFQQLLNPDLDERKQLTQVQVSFLTKILNYHSRLLQQQQQQQPVATSGIGNCWCGKPKYVYPKTGRVADFCGRSHFRR